MSSSASTLHLYRRLLRAAAAYPSKNRDSILREIRTAFREDAHKTGAAAAGCLEQARQAEEQLNRFPAEKTQQQDFEYQQR